MSKKIDTIFKRYEYKYLVTKSQRQYMEEVLRQNMEPDKYGEYPIFNIYYDTPTYRLVRRSLEKPVYKEKIRLRSYGRVGPQDNVFLELKKKYKGVVYKRRLVTTERAAMQYLNGTAPLPKESQIAKELDYFRQYYGSLKPAAFLSYDRTAWSCREDRNLRITFDQNICFRDHDFSLESSPGGRPLLEKGDSLMEIKAVNAMPLWLVHAMEDVGIRQTSFSKYGLAYQILEDEKQKGVKCSA